MSLKDLITRTDAVFLDEEICVVNNFLPEETLNRFLIMASAATEEEWALGASNPKGQWYGSVLPFDNSLSEDVSQLCTDLLTGHYHFTHSMYLRRRRESQGLLPHYDNQSQRSCEYGIVIYLNDDYEGGEIYYPNRGITHKPTKNSLVIHSAGVDYTHGVNAVKSGTRLFITLWAFYNDIEGQ
jgi:hypothetical protein